MDIGLNELKITSKNNHMKLTVQQKNAVATNIRGQYQRAKGTYIPGKVARAVALRNVLTKKGPNRYAVLGYDVPA